MNDNVHPTDINHLLCLDVLHDLHGLFTWAKAYGVEFAGDDPSVEYAMDLEFWRDQIGNILRVSGNYRKDSVQKYFIASEENCAARCANDQ